MITEMNIRAGGKIAPDFMLKLDDRDVTQNFSHRLISLSMIDKRGLEADQLDIQLDDSDGLLDLPARGARLSLWLGWEGTPLEEKGDFTIDAIQFRGAPDTLTIRGFSADFRGKLNVRREQSWHDTTIGAIVDTIAQRNQLTASVSSGLASIAISHIDQSQETDAAFLSRLAERNGAFVSIKAGKVIFMKAGQAVTASGTPIPLMMIERGDGDKHLFSVADRENYSGVTAKWLQTRDPKQQNPQLSISRQSSVQPTGALQHPGAVAPVAETGGKEQKPQERLVGSAENVFELTTVYASEEQALRAAEAKWRALQRGTVEFSIQLALGRADLFPETPVLVNGFKRVIDEQAWIISEVVHTLNDSGFTTQLKLELNVSDEKFTVDSE
ncbi:phage late control D family protein [Enterobacter quasiroggenkampii]|uniref:phage late control D family protein n=1 Tax=Enterobacter quasiroggenkampii TaxID=2497436 RepID=UPI0020048E3A|nr:phage late control D family protein [Enterobacter quasiroggenkampii]MCK7309133.1 phage late control D family protein [Enterobacter quasiroggenkampii]MCU6347808.1 phage late control D family protein [Enterobacter quasiroggenkampii]MCU6385045.1 phage late control D family protein [Enterobacter quasiroggenkampii]MCU6394417.1 phage late control D family protein [Enterobacter quasiroggenkampii]MCU6403834.1 phage late control D family protein [Enterobacter quasiroggenkampii]